MLDRPPLLVCRDLRFAWNGLRDVIALPRLEVRRDERVFIHGPSGSGKSTLLSLITGMITPRIGNITLLGKPLSHLPATRRDRLRADHIGYIFQQFNLLPYLDVVDNVLLSCAFSRRRHANASLAGSCRDEAERLLDALGLDGAALQRQRATELSVGQQQRVAAARALIGHPELIVADEPTSALDTDARDAFLDLLLAECARHHSGLLFVSHDLGLAKHFDRMVRLDAMPQTAAA
nr:ABC transporter ATP-binding protein [Dyella sedimenti]